LAKGKKHLTLIQSSSELIAVDNVSQLILQTQALKEIGDTGLLQLSFFRWVWEPQSIHEVSVVMKADDPGVNRALWVEMEPEWRARED
jgi:hypothetical protein